MAELLGNLVADWPVWLVAVVAVAGILGIGGALFYWTLAEYGGGHWRTKRDKSKKEK